MMSERRIGMWRSRWAAVGAALAVGLLGGNVVRIAGAGDSSPPSAFVAITPCRLFDTRSGSDNVGPRATPLTPGDVFIAQVTGTNGRCTLPASTTGVALNVTIANPTSASFLTVFPADSARPVASHLNWAANSSPTPNGVTVRLSPTGAASFANASGAVDVIADVVGYYTPTGPGAAVSTGSALLDNEGTVIPPNVPYDIMSLTQEGTGAITLGSTGRLVVDVSITLAHGGAPTDASAILCWIEAEPGTRLVGGGHGTDLSGGNGFERFTNLALNGSIAVPAGTYDVAVVCQGARRSGTTDPTVATASMNVLAVPG